MSDTPSRLVTILEASALAGVSRRTIYNWLGQGKLQFARTAGGSIRIVRASLFRDGTATAQEAAAAQ